jgi:DNA polymerase-3 subunit beta
MEFTCTSKELKKVLTIVEKSVPQKSSISALQNFYVVLEGNTLKFRGNNLEMGIENQLSVANVKEQGSFLVQAKTLTGVISKIEDERINFSIDDKQKITIKGEKVDFDLLGSNTQDYPVFPNIESGLSLKVKAEELISLIKHTLISVSYDETKQFLNGIFVKNEGDQLFFVATDGYRLSVKSQIISPLDSPINCIIPYKTIAELQRILSSDENKEDVQMIISDKQIVFRFAEIVIISRLIQGQFPDYNQVCPKKIENSIKVNREEFLQASERASIIASASNNIVRFEFIANQLNMVANAKGMGDFHESLDIERLLGETQLKIVFNIRLLLDVLKISSAPYMYIGFNNELSPCQISFEGDDTFKYVIMPIRTADYYA